MSWFRLSVWYLRKQSFEQIQVWKWRSAWKICWIASHTRYSCTPQEDCLRKTGLSLWPKWCSRYGMFLTLLYCVRVLFLKLDKLSDSRDERSIDNNWIRSSAPLSVAILPVSSRVSLWCQLGRCQNALGYRRVQVTFSQHCDISVFFTGVLSCRNLDRDIEGSAKRWKKYVESEAPEKEKLPQEWKTKTSVQKLCIMRALRPDRMTYALT